MRTSGAGAIAVGLVRWLPEELVKKLGGEIRSESAEDTGSSFRVSLPLAAN